MNTHPAKRYAKVVYWSDEDQCYIGSSPGLTGRCCHGDDEHTVFRQLCEIVEDVLDAYANSGDPLPTPSAVVPFSEHGSPVH